MTAMTAANGNDGEDSHNGVPAAIRPEHKQRLAAIYIRQSSEHQVRHHKGSTESQRDLAARPRLWGWPEPLIKIIDEDLGFSGSSSSQRTGFQELVDLMVKGEVGLVLVRDVSRISRNPLDSEIFLAAAIKGDVLIEANGRVYEPGTQDLAELFNIRVLGLIAWFENAQRTATFRAAKEARVRAGYAVSRPPIGYISTEKGKWSKDPTPGVQEAVRRVFELYLELRSIRRVALVMRERGLLFPRRRRGVIEWIQLSALGALRILNSPNYTADYHFRSDRRTYRGSEGASE